MKLRLQFRPQMKHLYTMKLILSLGNLMQANVMLSRQLIPGPENCQQQEAEILLLKEKAYLITQFNAEQV